MGRLGSSSQPQAPLLEPQNRPQLLPLTELLARRSHVGRFVRSGTCAPDIAATAAVVPRNGATASTVAGNDGRPMTPRVAAPPSADTTPSQPLNASIDRLKLEQHRLKTTKKQIIEELRNAERKRKRLR